ncbi:hypothetical protein ACE939_15240 [Aquimarina sp. W85]|uniref:hypothetical protein n=1 Tax=Aquimarina rhodophyticola TaxID=3342246 RepID=UPI00366C737B
MMNKTEYIIWVFLIILFGAFGYAGYRANLAQSELKLTDFKNEFTAGEKIVLSFKNVTEGEFTLLGNTSYGPFFMTNVSHNGMINFNFPEHLAKNTGSVTYKIRHNDKIVYSGNFNISTKKIVHLETYIGPPSILAGGKDFSMVVVVPTDSFNNPIGEPRTIQMKHQFGPEIFVDTVVIKDLIGWKRLYSYPESGKILFTSTSSQTTSKEYTVDVTSDIATDFNIYSERLHEYADGNQLITFYTSVIKDSHTNVVTDGTLVTFNCQPDEGLPLQTYGTTIGGIAKAILLHPDKETSWLVEAYVTGIAKSNSLSVTFKKAVSDFEVKFTNKNRVISIGPLHSFMGQLMPDGAVVRLLVDAPEGVCLSMVESSKDGFVKFYLSEDFYEAGSYNFVIQALGITKTFKNIVYE